MEIYELGSIVVDKVTKQEGTLTHFNIDMSENKMYLFQPNGLNTKTKLPISAIWLTESRIVGEEKEEIEISLEVLGTIVVDKASGFKGTAIAMTRHINGCVHVEVKSEGTLEDGETIPTVEFDIRRLEGEKVPKINKKQLKESIEENPSPIFTPNKNKK